jgi:hypothetical protein
MACTALFASLVLLTASTNIKEKKPIKTGNSSRHITNLKQSILETFDVYATAVVKWQGVASRAGITKQMNGKWSDYVASFFVTTCHFYWLGQTP